MNVMPTRDSKHITIRVQDDFANCLTKAKEHEDMTLSVFVRTLLRWAMRHYEYHGSLLKLFDEMPAPKNGRRAA